jgi:hypothetical protein
MKSSGLGLLAPVRVLGVDVRLSLDLSTLSFPPSVLIISLSFHSLGQLRQIKFQKKAISNQYITRGSKVLYIFLNYCDIIMTWLLSIRSFHWPLIAHCINNVNRMIA